MLVFWPAVRCYDSIRLFDIEHRSADPKNPVPAMDLSKFLMWRRPVTPEPPEPSQAAADMLIVRQVVSPSHHFFLQVFAREQNLEIVQDRRGGERRRRAASHPEEKRTTERRGPKPATWLDGDFIVVKRDKSD